MERVTAGRAAVEALRGEGVRFVFGLPGGHVLSIYDALYSTPEIRHVLVRHEQAAASMAAAHAQLTGEPGVCLVTAGPGCTNLVSGIADAYVGSRRPSGRSTRCASCARSATRSRARRPSRSTSAASPSTSRARRRTSRSSSRARRSSPRASTGWASPPRPSRLRGSSIRSGRRSASSATAPSRW